MKKILFVHQGENIAYLIDRIENTKDQNIYLNIDANLDLFSDVTNLKLLKREIDFLGKNIIIVSKDNDVLSFAESLGFNTEPEEDDEKEATHLKEIKESLEDGQEDNSSMHFLDKQDTKEQPLKEINRPDFLQNKNDENNQEIQGSVENLYEEEDDEKTDNVGSFFEKSMEKKSDDIESSIFKKRGSENEAVERKKINLNFKKIFSSNKKLTYIAGALIFVLILGSFYIFRSKATLNIAVKKETLDFTFPVTADTGISEINIKESRVPGQIIKLENEVSGEFKATGASEGATKASGKLTIYNEYGKDSQSLVANTRFQTKDGKIFRIQKRVTVPGAKVKNGKIVSPGILEVEVLADKPGSEYNIGPTDFKIPGFEGTPKYDGFYAKSSEKMTGGSLGEKRAISESDLKKAKEDLLSKLKKSRSAFIKENIPNNLVFLDTGMKEDFSELESPKEGSAADTFTAKLKANYTVIAFDQKDIDTLTEKSLALRLKEERKTYPDTKIISYEDGVISLDGSSFEFSVRASEVVGGNLNLKKLKEELSGKGEIEIRKILTANDAIETAEITLWPFWSTKAPDNPEMIKVMIKD